MEKHAAMPLLKRVWLRAAIAEFAFKGFSWKARQALTEA